MEDSSPVGASQSIEKGVSFNAQNFAITIGNASTEETQKSNNTNRQSLFTSPFTSLRSLTRRSLSKESPSVSEITPDEATDELMKKAFNSQETDLEKKNLLNMIKMSVKNLIESSLAAGHTLDNDNQALQQFFIIFENVLRHRLKGSKRFFIQNKYCWPALEAIEKFHSSAGPINVSVRSLPGIKEWYEDDAVLVSEEASIMLGHLIGINCIDANLCLREMDLDNQTTLVDFSLYLKDSEHNAKQDETIDDDSLTQKLLDQKNYLEERNRHLETNLSETLKKLEADQATIETQRTDLEALKIQLSSLYSANQKLKTDYEEMQKSHQETLQERERDLNAERDAWTRSKSELDRMVLELKVQLKQETAMRLDVEKELQREVGLKQELEMVVKLHESDLSHKQQGLVALREQLDNVKTINADLYLKLQARNNEDENDNNTVESWENGTETLKIQVTKLQEDLDEAKRQEGVAREQATRYSNQLDDSEKSRNVLSTNLQIERDWRQNLQKEEEKHKQEITLLQEKIEMMLTMKEEMEQAVKERDRLLKVCQDKGFSLTGKPNEVGDEALNKVELSLGEG